MVLVGVGQEGAMAARDMVGWSALEEETLVVVGVGQEGAMVG